MKKISIVSLILLLLSGCVTKQIVDEIQLASSVGFDYVDDNMIRGTANVTVHKWKEEVEMETIFAVSTTTKDVGFLLNTKSSKPLHLGKLSSILISEELARKMDIMEIIDTFTRNPAVGRRLFLAITSGPAYEMYNVEKLLERNISMDIRELIRNNIDKQNIPKTNFHVFLKQVYEIGQTPYLPYISKVEDLVQITGIALLRQGSFVHKLDLDEAFTLKLLAEKFSNGFLDIVLPSGEKAVLRNIESKTKYKIEKNTNRPHITIDVLFKGTVNEYTGDIIDENVMSEINRTVTKKIETDIQNLLHLLQKLELDPIGIGRRVKAVNYNFDIEEWNEHYKNMKFDVNVKTIIAGHGISK